MMSGRDSPGLQSLNCIGCSQTDRRARDVLGRLGKACVRSVTVSDMSERKQHTKSEGRGKCIEARGVLGNVDKAAPKLAKASTERETALTERDMANEDDVKGTVRALNGAKAELDTRDAVLSLYELHGAQGP